ncbi:hypothetical protein JCM8547_003681 [Rhodosporidiobolus lusitaniae]
MLYHSICSIGSSSLPGTSSPTSTDEAVCNSETGSGGRAELANLPPELLLLILEHSVSSVHPYQRSTTLSQAALVSRQWHDLAEPLLYEVVAPSSKEAWEGLSATLVKRPELGRWTKSLRLSGWSIDGLDLSALALMPNLTTLGIPRGPLPPTLPVLPHLTHALLPFSLFVHWHVACRRTARTEGASPSSSPYIISHEPPELPAPFPSLRYLNLNERDSFTTRLSLSPLTYASTAPPSDSALSIHLATLSLIRTLSSLTALSAPLSDHLHSNLSLLFPSLPSPSLSSSSATAPPDFPTILYRTPWQSFVDYMPPYRSLPSSPPHLRLKHLHILPLSFTPPDHFLAHFTERLDTDPSLKEVEVVYLPRQWEDVGSEEGRREWERLRRERGVEVEFEFEDKDGGGGDMVVSEGGGALLGAFLRRCEGRRVEREAERLEGLQL